MRSTLGGCRILVVEDNFALAETLYDLLKECGCETVGPVARVSAALPLCTDHLDGALLDINLGKETCFEIADRLTQHDVPFIFLSGHSDDAMIPLRFRSVPRLQKPYDHDAIVNAAEAHFCT